MALQALFGAFKLGQWLADKLAGGSSGARGPRQVHYTLVAVPPGELGEFAAANAPAYLVNRFCDLLLEGGYPDEAVQDCLRSAADMKWRHPGHVIVVARVWEE